MNYKTIVLKLFGNTIKNLFLCSLILASLCLSKVYAADEEETDAAPVKTSAYVSLGEPMVLNLSGGKRLTFLQLSADVLVKDSDAEEIVKIHVPAIRHSLIVLLGDQNVRDIKSPNKREEIRQQATAQVQTLIAGLSDSKYDGEILFSNILVQ